MAPLPEPAADRRPRRFLTVYDLAFIRFPEIYGTAYREALLAGLGSLRNGDHIITTSRFVRDELASAGHAPLDHIHVVPLAADPAIFHPCGDAERIAVVRRKYRIPDGPYTLGVNTPDLRKNVPLAIQAFARAVAAQPDALRSMVLTGHRGPGSDRLERAIAEHPALRGRFIVTGYVPDEDLAPLYTGARVFVYGSIYEGFGLPPLEAMQCGTPVITSDTSSLPEVVGDGGVMVSPHDVDALAAAMLEVADDWSVWQQRALARARTFSWDRSVAATLLAYRTALQQ
jgi:glycosyltransferase involved in cell wall biosynthesis